MLKLAAVAMGGLVGALARYGLSGLVHRLSGAAFPAGTLAVNALGCLVMGGLMTLVEDHQMFGPAVRLFLMVGLLGSFTTFSTFGYETIQQLRGGETLPALANVALNVGLGLGAVVLGRAAARGLGI